MIMIVFEKGTRIIHDGIEYKIRRLLADRKSVISENIQTGEVKVLPVSEIRAPNKKEQENDQEEFSVIPIELLSEKQVEQGESRLKIIKPFLKNYCDPIKIKKAAKKHKIGASTIYKWRSRYLRTRSITSLVDREGRGGKGKTRLPKEVEKIVNAVIESVYLKQKKSVTRTIKEIEIQCKDDGLPVPSINTIKNRISAIAEFEIAKHRRGPRKAAELFGQKTGKIKGADYPLSWVQIDHTKLDIVIVDDAEDRGPLGRPWVTILIDLFSRVPIGLYISLDPPGNFGTGFAIATALFPKDKMLAKFGIDAEWPIWGPMKLLHCDNAGEFHSKMLENACQQYGISLKFRVVKKPHYGAHIERFLGTFNREIHDLPGTTYSNSQERKFYDYDSAKYAAFTLQEIEEWLLTYITKIYMLRPHKGLGGMSPLEKLKQGLRGSSDSLAIGYPILYDNENQLRLDFMPFVERTVQGYGVEIDHIKYFHDILRPYINVKTDDTAKSKRAKKKFQFKVDPRDISQIYFLDPQTKEYFLIPYADLSGPPMSKWEKRDVERTLKKGGFEVNEQEIFKGYKRLRELEENAIKKTKAARRNAHRRSETKRNGTPSVEKKSASVNINNEELSIDELIPFEVDHESFT
jgi:putative transposase